MYPTTEYLVSAKIIQFFWFLTTLLMVVYVLVIKFFLKMEIHPTKTLNEQKYVDVKPSAPKDDEQQEIVSNANPSQPPQADKNLPLHEQIQIGIDKTQANVKKNVNQAIEQGIAKQVEDTLPIKFLKFIERLYDLYFPLLSVVILCINQFASYAFATFCVFAYLISVILFNEFEVQKGCSEACSKSLFKSLMHLWIFCLFINFLVVDES